MKPLNLLPLALVLALAAQADTFEIDKAESIFSIVTHKGGIAAAKAHNHIVYPGDYKADIGTEGSGIDGARFSLVFPTNALVPDEPEAQRKWFPRIKALGILEEPFVEIAEADRRKIHETMVSDEQLDAARFPDIKAELVKMEPQKSKLGDVEFTHAVTLRFTVHGETVEKAVPARVELTDDALKVEAVGKYKFTDFGVKPYSALLGAVKNENEFHLYVNFTAKRVQ